MLFPAAKVPAVVLARFVSRVVLAETEMLRFLNTDTLFSAGQSGVAFTTDRVIKYGTGEFESLELRSIRAVRIENAGGGEKNVVLVTNEAIESIGVFAETSDLEDLHTFLLANSGVPTGDKKRGPVPVTESVLVDPLCPTCSQPITSVGQRVIESVDGVRMIYFCRSCHTALGVSHRGGFTLR